MIGKREFIFSLTITSLLVTISLAAGRDRPLIQQLTAPLLHGEGPHWDSEKNVLFFVDIYDKKVYQYDPFTKKLTFATIGDYVGLIVPVQGTKNKFIVGAGTNLSVLTWNGQNTTSPFIQILDTVDKDKPGNRFNDGKSDAAGTLFLGTMGYENASGYVPPNQGTLFKTSKNKCKLEPVIPNVSISNGLAWSLDNRSMFYIDSTTKRIDRFDYDILTGSMTNRRTLIDFNKAKISGTPDGMTIDNNDNLWIACYDGAQIVHVNSSSGELIYSIPMPVDRVTSMTFGGAYYDILYVTTSRNGLTADQLTRQPAAGALFSISNIPIAITSPPIVGHYNVPVANCARIPCE